MSNKKLMLIGAGLVALYLYSQKAKAEKKADDYDYRKNGNLPTYADSPQVEWASKIDVPDDGSKVWL